MTKHKNNTTPKGRDSPLEIKKEIIKELINTFQTKSQEAEEIKHQKQIDKANKIIQKENTKFQNKIAKITKRHYKKIRRY